MTASEIKAPKLDKARKAWLAGLKVGDCVVVLVNDRRIVTRIYRRSRDGWGVWALNGVYLPASGKQSGLDRWLIPATEQEASDHAEREAKDKILTRLRAINWSQWNDFGLVTLQAVAVILWPEQTP